MRWAWALAIVLSLHLAFFYGCKLLRAPYEVRSHDLAFSWLEVFPGEKHLPREETDPFPPAKDLKASKARDREVLRAPSIPKGERGERRDKGKPFSTLSLSEVVAWGNSPPHYPPLALSQRITGTVTLSLLLTEAGAVADVQVIQSSGYNILDEEAIETAKGWTFPLSNPAASDKDTKIGVKISKNPIISITFRLDDLDP